MNIELPKDAEGREIPLDTKVLYGDSGQAYEIETYCYAVHEDMPDHKWGALLFSKKSVELKSIRTTALYLTPPDSWEELEEDLGRGADALNYEACAYFGKSACDCSSCIADKGGTCERVVMRDIASRIPQAEGRGRMTDEELNEIASRLRRTANDSLGGESLQKALARITVAEDVSWRGVMRRIADLIECGVANRVETMYDTYCGHCGRHLDMDMDFCPACGGKIKYREERYDGRGLVPGERRC